MGLDIFSKISTLLNRVVEIIKQSGLERVRVLNEFNRVFKTAFEIGEFERLCSVTTSRGNQNFRHELSTIYLRSGFKITIMNDDNLKKQDFSKIAKYFVINKAFARKLMALGYDTLLIKGKSSTTGLEIPLKEIASLNDYMVN
jgi:hypothetical protein